MAHEIANNDITNAIGNNPGIKISIVRPENELPSEGVLDFSQKTIDLHIKYGYEMAKNNIG